MEFARLVFSPALSLLATRAVLAKDTSASCPAFKAGIDADNDGTLDLNEAKAAASKLFELAIQTRMAR